MRGGGKLHASCNATLVINVGLHKMGTTTFGDFKRIWGYDSIKLTMSPHSKYDYSRHDLELAKWQGGKLLTMFQTYGSDLPVDAHTLHGRNGLAVSDFPVFGIPCALSAAYPRAHFMYFRRSFESWFPAWREDILCQWMERDITEREHQWKRGVEFMRMFWGHSFISFFANGTALCADPCSAVWLGIKAEARAIFERHYALVTSADCIDPSRLLVEDLADLEQRTPRLRNFLGCKTDDGGPWQSEELPNSNIRGTRPSTHRASSRCSQAAPSFSTTASTLNGGAGSVLTRFRSSQWFTMHIAANASSSAGIHYRMLSASLESLAATQIGRTGLVTLVCYPSEACKEAESVVEAIRGNGVHLTLRTLLFHPSSMSDWVVATEEAKLAFLNTLEADEVAVWFETDMLFSSGCAEPQKIFGGTPSDADMALTYRHPKPVNTGLILMRNTPAVRALHRRHITALQSRGGSQGGANQLLLHREFGQLPYNTTRRRHNVTVFSIELRRHILGDLYNVCGSIRRTCDLQLQTALKHLLSTSSPLCLVHFNGSPQIKQLMLQASNVLKSGRQDRKPARIPPRIKSLVHLVSNVSESRRPEPIPSRVLTQNSRPLYVQPPASVSGCGCSWAHNSERCHHARNDHSHCWKVCCEAARLVPRSGYVNGTGSRVMFGKSDRPCNVLRWIAGEPLRRVKYAMVVELTFASSGVSVGIDYFRGFRSMYCSLQSSGANLTEIPLIALTVGTIPVNATGMLTLPGVTILNAPSILSWPTLRCLGVTYEDASGSPEPPIDFNRHSRPSAAQQLLMWALHPWVSIALSVDADVLFVPGTWPRTRALLMGTDGGGGLLEQERATFGAVGNPSVNAAGFMINGGVMLFRPSAHTMRDLAFLAVTGAYDWASRSKTGGVQDLLQAYFSGGFPHARQSFANPTVPPDSCVRLELEFNLRTMHAAKTPQQMAIVHYAGFPKPWAALSRAANDTTASSDRVKYRHLPHWSLGLFKKIIQHCPYMV